MKTELKIIRADLAAKPAPPARPPAEAPVKRERMGLGDMIARLATPIAAALKLPCVDPASKQLLPESPCAKRKEFLNKLTRPKS